MKKVSVARWAVWALDNDGHLFVRREVTPVFPEGTHWQSIPNIGCGNVTIIYLHSVTNIKLETF